MDFKKFYASLYKTGGLESSKWCMKTSFFCIVVSCNLIEVYCCFEELELLIEECCGSMGTLPSGYTVSHPRSLCMPVVHSVHMLAK